MTWEWRAMAWEWRAMAFPLNLLRSLSPTKAMAILTAGAKMPSSNERLRFRPSGCAAFLSAFFFPAESWGAGFLLLVVVVAPAKGRDVDDDLKEEEWAKEDDDVEQAAVDAARRVTLLVSELMFFSAFVDAVVSAVVDALLRR